MALDDGQAESPIALRLINRVRKALVGDPTVLSADLAALRPDQASPDQTTANDGLNTLNGVRSDAMRRLLWGSEFELGRLARYRDYAEMYDRIPELKRILKVVVSMVFGGDPVSGEAAAAANRPPFEIVFGEGCAPETREVVEEAMVVLGLPVLVPQMFASGLRFGDAFLELIASLVEVVGKRCHRPGNVKVEWGVMERVERYRVTPEVGPANVAPQGNTGRPVNPLFMVHYAHERQFGDRYGEALYHSLRDPGRQFTATVDIIHVLTVGQGAQRKTIAKEMPKGSTALTIKQRINEMRTFLVDNNFLDGEGVLHKQVARLLDYADTIIPYRSGEAAPIFHDEPAPPLEALLKVAAFDRDRFYLGTGVPKALAGLLDDAHSRAALSEQGMHFAKLLRFWQQDAAIITLDILVRVMLIAGVPFDDGDILIRMNTLSEFNEKLTAEVLKLRAESAVLLNGINVPMRWILANVLRVPQHLIDPMMLELGTADEENPDDDPGAVPTPAEAAMLRDKYAEAVRKAEEWEGILALLKPLEVGMAQLTERLPGHLDAMRRLAEQGSDPLWGGKAPSAP